MNVSLQTEDHFVQALQSQGSADFSLLYAAYSPALYGVLLRLLKDPDLAQDLLQDAFVKIWSKHQHYDACQGRLFTWMLTITRNLALDELRVGRVRMLAQATVANQSDQLSYPRVADGLVYESLLGHLLPKYRAVVELIYGQGYTYQEVADILDIPLGTVKTRMRAALLALRSYLCGDIHAYQNQARVRLSIPTS